jgi:hypothetical protein
VAKLHTKPRKRGTEDTVRIEMPPDQTGGHPRAQAHAAEANVGRVVEAHRVVLISSMSP